jgi:membrane-associated protease RseP (regulator of RpoE activity)
MPAMPDMDYPVSVVVVHSWMRSGLMVENMTPQLGEFFGAKSGQGVLVRSVEKGSRAEKAGFHAGDVIVKTNGEPINDAGDFSRALRAGKDNSATITILRDKKEQTLTLTLPPRQTGQILNESFEVPEISVETQAALTQTRAEMEHSRGDIQEAMRVQSDELKKQLADFKSKTFDSAKFRAQMREMQRQLRDLEVKIHADI